MIFFTFHYNGIEIKIAIEEIKGFYSYPDGRHAVLLSDHQLMDVDEDWNFVQDKFKQLESATKQALMAQNVMRKVNGH
jgi:hypothetical protein